MTLELETPVCDLCGHPEQRILFPAKDRRHGGPGEFHVVECTRCSLRYLSPRPVASTIKDWYPDTYKAYRRRRIPRPGSLMDRLNSLWSGYQSLFLSAWYPTFYFTRHAPDAAISGRRPRLLDIGCGSGDKLRYIRRRSGWETYGVDFNTQAVDNARASGAGDVRLTDGERLPFEDDFFDAVYSWHSLEHHYSPSTTMAECSRVLRPGGYGVLAIPSGDSLGLRLLRGYWGPLEAPRHLYHFTKETLTRLIEHVGLKAHRAFYDFSFYGLFVDQEILESLEFAMQDTSSPVVALPRGLLKTLRVGGLLSSAATLPILPFNQRLGRLWRGTNLVLHFSKPANP